MTNFEKVKAMTLEELADWEYPKDGIEGIEWCDNHSSCLDTVGSCKECFLKWLKAEAVCTN